jgi:hypothetical protein
MSSCGRGVRAPFPRFILRLALVLAASARADDWPQWREPNRDGVWRETGILETIPASGPQLEMVSGS